jgi:hypothetical protein
MSLKITTPEIGQYLDKYPEKTNSQLADIILSEREEDLSDRDALKHRIKRLKKRRIFPPFLSTHDISKDSIRDVTINEWTTTSFHNGKPIQALNSQVKVRYNPNPVKDFKFEEHLNQYKVPSNAPHHNESDTVALINIYDAHINKLGVIDNNTIEQNLEIFIDSFNRLLGAVLNYNPTTILIPVGSDFFNSNGLTNTTKAGTPQDNSVKPHTAFDLGLRAVRICIDLARQFSRVEVIVIPGNHDYDTCFYLGKCLEFIYENDSNVNVESSYTRRKYYHHQNNLIAFAHGDIEKRMVDKLPLIMAEEQKELWAATKYRFWYLGDIHHKQEYKFLRGKDHIGVEVNFLRSISELDQWHYNQGYVGTPKSAEASVFSGTKGEVAKFKVNI